MSRTSVPACALAGALMVVGLPADARAQAWSVDLSGGQIVYNPASSSVGTSNLVGSVKYDARRDAWVYGTVAAPLEQDAPSLGGVGAGGRFVPSGWEARRTTVGVDVDAHGFMFRDAVADQIGRGGLVEAMPFASLSAGAGRVEVRGGWRGQTLSFDGVTETTGVVEAGARARYGSTLRLQGDARIVHASEGTFPFAGVSLSYDKSSISAWVRAGKWLDADLDDEAWSAGAGIEITNRTRVWAIVQQEAPDPLYWNAPRRSWSIGVTQRLGRMPRAALPAHRPEAGRMVIRVPVSDTPAGDLQVAGSFNNWQPTAMLREGSEWVIRLPLAAGAYEYAFRSAKGDWFVPDSVAGRRDDGMGGHVAVLVVY